MTEWIKNIGTEPNTQGKPFEVRLRRAEIVPSDIPKQCGRVFDWSLQDKPRGGDIIEWRFTETAELTQADVQSLLNIVRSKLHHATHCKDVYKTEAAESWNMCSKDNPNIQSFFELHSFTRKKALEAKQKEKKLVNLITKLKGLR